VLPVREPLLLRLPLARDFFVMQICLRLKILCCLAECDLLRWTVRQL
jgi:hypothetical protein